MKVFEGIVVATYGPKTVIVKVTRKVAHPMYGKLLKRSKRYKADIGQSVPLLGQSVKIVETRPISKEKHFKIMEDK